MARQARSEEGVRDNKRQGYFKLTLGDCTRWYRVEKTHYPSVKWWITEVSGWPSKPVKMPATRQLLTDELWNALEGWL